MPKRFQFLIVLCITITIASARALLPALPAGETPTPVIQTDAPITAIAVETVTPAPKQKPTQNFYAVTRVVDGDTFEIKKNGAIEKIRLIGMDTPETVDPRKPVQCFGKEASAKAKELLEGKSVRIETDLSQGTYDKYKRLLAYVYLEDGTFFNEYMIAEGYAHEYTYDLPYRYQKEFKGAEQTAREQGKGLWNPAMCNGKK